MSASSDIRRFVEGIHQARDKALAAAAKAVDVFAEHVIGDAQQLCPVDTGALQASGTTLPAEVSGTRVTKTIGFNTDYAAAVHENPSAGQGGDETAAQFKARKKANKAKGKKAKRRNRVGQWKYLQTAMDENRPKFSGFVGAQIEQALQGGQG